MHQDHMNNHVEVVSVHIFHIPLLVGLKTQIPDLSRKATTTVPPAENMFTTPLSVVENA